MQGVLGQIDKKCLLMEQTPNLYALAGLLHPIQQVLAQIAARRSVGVIMEHMLPALWQAGMAI